MSNYTRNVHADIWNTRRFAGYSAKQKLFWFYLHTSDETSDTSVFRLRLSRAADACGISKKEAKQILDGFIEDGFTVFHARLILFSFVGLFLNPSILDVMTALSG